MVPGPDRLPLEKTEGVGVVAHQQVLGLLVVLEGHLVGLATDAGLLVATEGGVGGILVVAVGPYATGLDATAHAVGTVGIPGPDACTETEQAPEGRLPEPDHQEGAQHAAGGRSQGGQDPDVASLLLDEHGQDREHREGRHQEHEAEHDPH